MLPAQRMQSLTCLRGAPATVTGQAGVPVVQVQEGHLPQLGPVGERFSGSLSPWGARGPPCPCWSSRLRLPSLSQLWGPLSASGRVTPRGHCRLSPRSRAAPPPGTARGPCPRSQAASRQAPSLGTTRPQPRGSLSGGQEAGPSGDSGHTASRASSGRLTRLSAAVSGCRCLALAFRNIPAGAHSVTCRRVCVLQGALNGNKPPG